MTNERISEDSGEVETEDSLMGGMHWAHLCASPGGQLR